MKLLLDENLSPRLARRLELLFPGITHVREAGLKQADDIVIWEWAKVNECTIVTTDADFVLLSRRLSYPPKVIHLEQCDFPLRVIEDLLQRNAVRISEFHKDAKAGVLAIRFQGGSNDR